jgi:hypothetical protein
MAEGCPSCACDDCTPAEAAARSDREHCSNGAAGPSADDGVVSLVGFDRVGFDRVECDRTARVLIARVLSDEHDRVAPAARS